RPLRGPLQYRRHLDPALERALDLIARQEFALETPAVAGLNLLPQEEDAVPGRPRLDRVAGLPVRVHDPEERRARRRRRRLARRGRGGCWPKCSPARSSASTAKWSRWRWTSPPAACPSSWWSACPTTPSRRRASASAPPSRTPGSCSRCGASP